ncbi:MAG: PEGA domain-containing protein [Myxococcales bacterium]|nr:PEGA domain-containing protein [Myxococcales bacterium]
MKAPALVVFLACVFAAIALPSSAWAQAQAPAAPGPDADQPAAPAAAPAAGAAPAAPAADAASAATPQTAAEAAVPAPPTDEQRAQAREAYGQGQALFAEDRYGEARVAFERAYSLIPNPVVLRSIAECDFKLRKLDDAYAGFERYLAEKPRARDRGDVESKMEELLAIPAILAITSSPAGAAISVDGKPTGQVTPAEIPLTRGEHRFELTLAGYNPVNEPVSARIGGRIELAAALQPIPAPEPTAEPEEVAEQAAPAGPPPPPPTAAIWASGVVAAAGLVGGSVLGFLALSERSDFDANPTDESADRGERLALFADVSFGIGAMALITGAVLYLTSDTEAAEPAPADAGSARLRLTPVVDGKSAGLIASGHF